MGPVGLGEGLGLGAGLGVCAGLVDASEGPAGAAPGTALGAAEGEAVEVDADEVDVAVEAGVGNMTCRVEGSVNNNTNHRDRARTSPGRHLDVTDPPASPLALAAC